MAPTILSATPQPAEPAPSTAIFILEISEALPPLTLAAHIRPVTIVAPVP